MERLRQWWDIEVEKIKGLSARELVFYIWDYYKLWIVSILSIVLVLGWGIHQYVSNNSDMWFFACFANTRADLGDGSQFWKDYAVYAGYDLSEKDLTFNAQLYVDTIGKTVGNQYYQLLIAYLDGGILDVLVMEKDRLLVIGASGRLMDLETEQMRTIYERYQDRLVYCEPINEEYGKDWVPVGIDLSGTVLVGEDGAYLEDAVLGISALAPHPEEAETFLAFLFESASQ